MPECAHYCLNLRIINPFDGAKPHSGLTVSKPRHYAGEPKDYFTFHSNAGDNRFLCSAPHLIPTHRGERFLRILRYAPCLRAMLFLLNL